MHSCIKRLLKTTDEESLESLSKLLTTIGKDLDLETSEKLKSISKSDAIAQVKIHQVII